MNSKKTNVALRRTLIALGAIAFALPFQAQADSTDVLLKVLVRKGILTEAEAAEVKNEVVAIEAAEREALVADMTTRIEANLPPAPAQTVSFGSSVSNLKLSGNFRLRYQYDDTSERSSRDRLRYRLEGDADYSFADSPWSAGVSVATSTGNDSTNVSFGRLWDKVGDELFVSRVALNYSGENFSAVIGKDESPFYITGAFWDSDLRPEGMSEQFAIGGVNVTAAQYFLDTSANDWLFMLQAETNVAGIRLAPIVMGTNDDGRSAATMADFLVVALPFEYKFEAFGMKQRVYGMWGVNLKGDDAINDPTSPYYTGGDASSRNQFFNAIYRLGDTKKAGDWRLELEYIWSEAAAYSPDLSNSDLLDSGLNMHGAAIQFRYMITDFLQANLLLHRAWDIESDIASDVTGPSEYDLVQADLQVNF